MEKHIGKNHLQLEKLLMFNDNWVTFEKVQLQLRNFLHVFKLDPKRNNVDGQERFLVVNRVRQISRTELN